MASGANPIANSSGGKLGENIMHFARILRQAGLPIGPGQVIDAISATDSGCLRNRDDFYWTLHSVMVNRNEDHVIFDEAFRLFWRSRDLVEKLLQMIFSSIRLWSK